MKYPKRAVLPLLILCLLVIISIVYWYGYKKPTIGIDDANIYLVYMKNLAEGQGLVWNTGGERVEGFTSLLWTLTGALLYKISATHVTGLLLITCFILSFFTLYNITRFARKLNHTEDKTFTVTDLIILSLLLLPRGFIEWNVLSIMETSLWMFLITTISLQLCNYYLQGKKLNLFSFSLLVIHINLTRPESIAFNLLFITILFLILYFDSGVKYSIRKTMVPLLAYIVSLAALFRWRIAYFGYPFPNTYYAKVSADKKGNILAGCRYLIKFFYFYPHAAFLIVVVSFFALAILLKIKQRTAASLGSGDRIQLILVAIVLAGLLLPVLTGGDNFMFSRFYLPLLPMLYLAATDYSMWTRYAGVSVQYKRTAVTAMVGALIFAAAFFSKLTISDFFMNDSGLIFPEFSAASEGRKAALLLNETFADCKNYPSIGAVATGGVGYMYSGKTIDLLGLNNTIMAHASTIKTGIRNHASFDKKGFWQLKPDILGTAFGGEIIKDSAGFVLYENMPGFRQNNFIYACMKHIHDDDDFRANYLPALLKHKNEHYFVFGYYAKPFLDSLDPSLYHIKLLDRTFHPHSSTSKL